MSEKDIKGLKELNTALDTFVHDVEIDSKVIFKKVAMDLITALSFYTPVDTGRARANWFVDINKTPKEKITKGFGNKKISEGEAKTITKEVTTKATGKMKDVTLGDSIHVANNIEYIKYLDDGTERIKPFLITEKAFNAIKQGITKK